MEFRTVVWAAPIDTRRFVAAGPFYNPPPPATRRRTGRGGSGGWVPLVRVGRCPMGSAGPAGALVAADCPQRKIAVLLQIAQPNCTFRSKTAIFTGRARGVIPLYTDMGASLS